VILHLEMLIDYKQKLVNKS